MSCPWWTEEASTSSCTVLKLHHENILAGWAPATHSFTCPHHWIVLKMNSKHSGARNAVSTPNLNCDLEPSSPWSSLLPQALGFYKASVFSSQSVNDSTKWPEATPQTSGPPGSRLPRGPATWAFSHETHQREPGGWRRMQAPSFNKFYLLSPIFPHATFS